MAFRKMITPVIIQIIFILGVIFCVLGGLWMVSQGGGAEGLLMAILGPVVCRIYCELMIVIFTINDTLTDIRTALRSRSA